MKYQSRTSKTHLRTAVAFAVITATSSSAQADDFSYNYVDGGYARIDDFNGVGIRGSVEFLDNFRAIGAVSYLGDNGVDRTAFSEVEPSIGYALGDTDELTLGIEGRYRQ